jgi:MFS transporter, PAT family, beta-lactamase induction signal transducer AmpG
VSQNIEPSNNSQASGPQKGGIAAPSPIPTPSPKTFGQTYGQIFASRRIAWMLFLGFASGLPLALSTGTLQAWLTVEGLDIKTIGFFALAGLPYTFKFVWAPLLDRFEPPSLPRRKGWLIFTQAALAGLCFVMATLDAKSQVEAVGLCAVLIAFFSASQDIVFDAYRSDVLPAEERGVGAAVSVLGYRLAMLVSGALALILAEKYIGWPNTYRAIGTIFALLVFVSWTSPSLNNPERVQSSAALELRGFAVMLLAGGLCYYLLHKFGQGLHIDGRFAKLGWETLAMMAALVVAIFAARKAGFPSFVAPWDAFFTRDRALWLLALIVLYKLGDAFASALSTTFLIRGVGFSATEVGVVNKGVGLVATIVGALVGGAWLAKRSLFNSLLLFGVLQAISNVCYWALSVLPKSYELMAGAILIENLCGGMGTAAFVALMMALTDKRFSAAQFALLSALAAVGRVYVGPTSGVMVEAFGWPTFFLWSIVAAIPGLLMLIWLRREIDKLPGALP